MIDEPIRKLNQIPPAGEQLAAAGYIQPHPRATPFERSLLLTSVAIFPLQDYFPSVAGMSTSFIFFATLAAYVIVNRLRSLGEIWCHPVFITAYVFVAVTALLEFSSPLSKYEEIIRFAQMIGGAVCVAVICRDRSALAAGLYGYIAAALWVSVVLYLTSYGTLQGMGTADDFDEASKIRAQAFGEKALGANLNRLAIVCVQGAVVAFALTLSDRWKHLRAPLVGITAFCLIASFLPMSRGAVVMSLMSFAVILYAHGARQGKILIVACVLGMGIYAVVPGAVWSRMSFSTETKDGGKMEARAYLYTRALNRLPEYIVAGVGVGNYYSKWGMEKGFTRGSPPVVLGVHNSLLQITINWGILGLLTFLLIIWCIYRSIPLRCGRDGLSVALLGIILSLGTLLLQGHIFYDKALSFGIGMLIGARQWIWPTGIVSEVAAAVAKMKRFDERPLINRHQ